MPAARRGLGARKQGTLIPQGSPSTCTHTNLDSDGPL